jgi:CO dehydrogenase/acetyl-CoA synthase epsilon subunit
MSGEILRMSREKRIKLRNKKNLPVIATGRFLQNIDKNF